MSKMNCRLWISIGISGAILVPSIVRSEARPIESAAESAPARFRPFLDESASHEDRLEAARGVTSATEEEREYLHISIRQASGDARLYALTALVTLRDPASVDRIGNALLETENRYYALALGILGFEEGVAYLNQMLQKTRHDYVAHDCRLALRMLGAQDVFAEAPPSPTGPLAIHLRASTNSLSLGQPFVLMTTVSNTLDHPVRIAYGNALYDKHLHAYSPERSVILPMLPTLDLDPSANSFPLLAPGGILEFREECTVSVLSPPRKEWPELLPPQKVFCLQGRSWGYEIALWQVGEAVDVDLAIVYRPPDVSEQLLEKLGLSKSEILTAPSASNTTRIHMNALGE